MFQQHKRAEMLRLARQLLGGPWKETLALWFRKALGGNDVKSGGSLAAPRTHRRLRSRLGRRIGYMPVPITVVCSYTEDSPLVSRELNIKRNGCRMLHSTGCRQRPPALLCD